MFYLQINCNLTKKLCLVKSVLTRYSFIVVASLKVAKTQPPWSRW